LPVGVLMLKMEKITKAKAKKLYDNGIDIYLNPSKMNPNGVWHKAMKVSKPYFESTIYDAPTFEQLVNNYNYYNCNKEMGLVVHFYK
jgi:hypothetical protein